MDYIKAQVSELEANDDIMWRGKVCRVLKRLGPVSVKIQEYKNKEVALEGFKDKFYVISEDLIIDKVITR